MRPIIYDIEDKLNLKSLREYTELTNIALFDEVFKAEEAGKVPEYKLKDPVESDTALSIIFNSDFFDKYPEEDVLAYLNSEVRLGMADAMVRYSQLISVMEQEDITIEA